MGGAHQVRCPCGAQAASTAESSSWIYWCSPSCLQWWCGYGSQALATQPGPAAISAMSYGMIIYIYNKTSSMIFSESEPTPSYKLVYSPISL